MVRVEVLFFAGCPSHAPTVALIRDVARDLGADVDIHDVEVNDQEDAQRLRFLGSPTVRVEGNDIESARRGDSAYTMSCRLYALSGIPSRALIEAALAPKDGS